MFKNKNISSKSHVELTMNQSKETCAYIERITDIFETKAAVSYLCDTQDAYIRTGGGGAISCSKKSIQDAGNTLNKNPSAEMTRD